MDAVVLGIRRLNFDGRDGKVNKTQFFVAFNSNDVEGQECGIASWDAIATKKDAPSYEVGEVIDVAFDRKGKLQLQIPIKATA